jgi:spore maturation protein CgeB
MRKAGHSPSVRLFEAAACGTPIISDDWHGLETFFKPDREIAIAHTSADVIAALQLPKGRRNRIGMFGRKRVLLEHTSDRRAAELEDWLTSAMQRTIRAVPGRRGEPLSMDYLS